MFVAFHDFLIFFYNLYLKINVFNTMIKHKTCRLIYFIYYMLKIPCIIQLWDLCNIIITIKIYYHFGINYFDNIIVSIISVNYLVFIRL